MSDPVPVLVLKTPGVTTVSALGSDGVGGVKTLSASELLEASGALSASDVGTTAGKLIALDGSAKLPAVDGSQLTGISSAGAINPRVIIGDKFYSIRSQALQLFYRGMVEAVDPYQYFLRFTGVADAYRANRRYFSVNLGTTFTHPAFTVSVQDSQENILYSQVTNVQIVDTVAQPVTATRVLCIGDSLTSNNSAAWVTELNRRLTGTGGSPAGMAYGNITFIGTQGTGANRHEGYSGRTWQWHSEAATSPFASGGALNFANYVSANSFGGIEQVYILLGWNTITSGGATAASWSADVTRAQTLIGAIRSSYPSVKVTLISMQAPNREGRIANRSYLQELRAVFGYKLAIKSIADNPTYSSYVDWIDLAAQFDSEHNMPATATAVNSRNTGTTELVGSDAIHPIAAGYNQIADAVYRHFVAKWCQGV
jgi:lysophospholipase L1-like esterase